MKFTVCIMQFTFHYVSIKSGKHSIESLSKCNLHSTMYLLNQYIACPLFALYPHLHSTMYLLNPKFRTRFKYSRFNLHSTMYLLNQELTRYSLNLGVFTFHYVSIKSNVATAKNPTSTRFTFHYVSIKSALFTFEFRATGIFTFHYVSIKSEISTVIKMQRSYLHSTMYLLNLRQSRQVAKLGTLFTFHYVSIKSK